MTKKLVINTCFGGFGLSDKCFELYLTRKEIKFYKDSDKYGTHYYTSSDKCDSSFISPRTIARDDSVLVEMVENSEAEYKFADLKVVEIPDDVEYTIDNYDGVESIHEKHRVWDQENQ